MRDMPEIDLTGNQAGRLADPGGPSGPAGRRAVRAGGPSGADEFDIRSLQGIEALRNLKHLEITPLDRLPAEQIAALRAAGVTVTDL